MVRLALKRFGKRARLRRTALPSIVVRLPDGRVIAVEEYGDPNGVPVLYFHGWPASRLEAGLIGNLPVRLLAFDRPGYGRSTSSPGRSLLDWPVDVASVADRLGLGRFYIVGLSGGGPFAAACAYAMPHRIAGLALVCPVPPASSMSHHAPGVGHLFRLGRHPKVAHRLLSLLRPLLHRRIITPRTLVGNGLPASDRAVLTRPMLAGLARAWREGVGRSVQGALSDANIYAADWGFPLSGITVPTTIWHGGADSLIPRVAVAPYEAVPGSVLHLLPDEGHYSLPLNHAGRILHTLVARDGDGIAPHVTGGAAS